MAVIVDICCVIAVRFGCCSVVCVCPYVLSGGNMNSIKCTMNPIASFFNMLHAFTSGCRMNQDFLAADDSLSVIGALLQKVSTLPSFPVSSCLMQVCYCRWTRAMHCHLYTKVDTYCSKPAKIAG